MATRGRWKKKLARRSIFIRRALSWTEKNPKEIAERGVPLATVYVTNSREKIRPPELVKEIAVKARGKAKKEKLMHRTKKVCFFSDSKKQLILAEKKNMAIIVSIAKQWWESGAIKKEFGNFGSFLNDLNHDIFGALDYFDPTVVGKKGKPTTVRVWIASSTRLFCKRLYFDARRKQETEIAAITGSQRITARGWLYPSAKSLFEKLGLNPQEIIELGVNDVTKELIRISEEKQTGLTKQQRKVLRLRLEGKEFRQIAKIMGLKAHSASHDSEARAVSKLKKRLAKM